MGVSSRWRQRRYAASGGMPPEIFERFERQHRRIAAVERELARVLPQVAALEERMEDLRERLEHGAAPTVSEPADPAVRALWEDITRQHEQVRARISAAARFEERLRQLEDTIGSSAGDVS